MIYNRIPITIGAARKITGPAINWKDDVKQVLVIHGMEERLGVHKHDDTRRS